MILAKENIYMKVYGISWRGILDFFSWGFKKM